MRTKISGTAVALCALCVGTTVLAQETVSGARTAAAAISESQATLTKGELKAMREFKMLDFNGDGKLSRTEVKLFPRLAAAFDEADTDGDGYVSYQEVRVFAARYRAEKDRLKAAQAAAAPPQVSPAAAPEPRP